MADQRRIFSRTELAAAAVGQVGFNFEAAANLRDLLDQVDLDTEIEEHPTYRASARLTKSAKRRRKLDSGVKLT